MINSVLTRIIVVFSFLCCVIFGLQAGYQPEFSTAGFFSLPNTGRQAYSMNVAWRFFKGDIVGDAFEKSFDDSSWSVVSLPHGIEYLPIESSGCVNYQGVVWYRKHFMPEDALKGKKLFLHFEAIMGKCKIWVNGRLVKEHFGGYLPVIADISDDLKWGEDNVIAVWADNSDDITFPPGKSEDTLDFTYMGGIYRDCWLVAHNDVFITDPNYESIVAGGGLFVYCDQVSPEKAIINLKAHIRNARTKGFRGTVEYELVQPNGKKLTLKSQKINIPKLEAKTATEQVEVIAPLLWTPETPVLYHLNVYIRDGRGTIVDGYRRRIGIRSIEFKGKDGFWLNGKPYNKPLIGGNRHQDFAIVGNALSNNINWRDAKKLKDAGFNVLRLSHYPQDPSFMDACDEMGIFLFEPTPGWQFWNNDPIFGRRVEDDIRQMVRRDRNHPSLLCWEPILNETGLWGESRTYDHKVQGRAAEIVKEEYPYEHCYPAGGPEESFPVLYGGVPRPDRVYFTREYGDGGNVNDWHGQNAPNRASRAWGEVPMLIQAKSYAEATDGVYRGFQSSPQHLGGAVWHSFDTQRGYHPDPFYGGIMDLFRQPKYSYYMFMVQRDPNKSKVNVGSGPMVYIAHEMTPFSPSDVTVFSNCDEVRLTVFEGGEQFTYVKNKNQEKGLPSPVITFKNAYSYDTYKEISRANHLDKVYMLAEGLIDGEIVATHRVFPSNRAERVILTLDDENVDLVANGSDFVTVVASIADSKGNVKRLNNYHILFEVEGEGRILGDASTFSNPSPVIWGDAPILIQSTTCPGEIKIKARVAYEGSRAPVPAELVIRSVADKIPLIYDKKDAAQIETGTPNRVTDIFNRETKQRKSDADLIKVHQQQEHFLQK